MHKWRFLDGMLVLMMVVLVLNLPFAGNCASSSEEEIKIGVLYELSGPLAKSGTETLWGVEFAADIVNNKYPELGEYLPIAEWEGIPSLGGAKIKLIVKDTRAEPDRAADLAEKLIKDEGVIGLIGCRISSVTKTASTVAERYGIPFLNASSSSPTLTQRGYKWLWRTSPHDGEILPEIFEVMEGLARGKVRGVGKVPIDELNNIAIACENTEWGSACYDILNEIAPKYNFNIQTAFKYPHETPDLSGEATKLLSKDPDAILLVPYLSDAILWIRTLKERGASPKILWGHSGFFFAEFGKTLGKDINGALTTTAFVPKLAEAKPFAGLVNSLFKARYGEDFSGAGARSFVAMQTFARVLDIAGSTSPKAIQKAFYEVYIPPEELIVPYEGVKLEDFDGHTGQNSLGKWVVAQYQGGEEIAEAPLSHLEIIYPFDLATSDLLYPFPGWAD